MKKTSKLFVQIFIVCALIIGVMGLGLQMQSASAKPAAALGAWTLNWSDEFNGSGAVSGTNWIYDIGTGYGCGTCGGWGTGELESMTNSTANVNQTGGHLAITPLHTGTNPVTGWTSGRIETQRTDFQPPAGGAMAIEASIQQPNVSGAAAQGYWPAFWALGAPFRGVYTNWPGIGELDILEDVNGQSNVYGTLHCGVSPGGPCNETTGIGSGAHACSGCQTGYHTYRIEFDKSVSPQQLRWYLDGVKYFTVNANQVDATTWANATNHGFFIILNVAMGGGWPGSPTSSTVSGVPMNVDYVRVYYANSGTSATATRTRTPTPGTGPTATRTKTPVASGDFSQSVTSLSSTSSKVTFVSNVNSTFVDIHYTGAPGLGQQNFRMAQSGNTWTQTISGLTTGTVITYWFTYEKSGLAYDTAHYTFTK